MTAQPSGIAARLAAAEPKAARPLAGLIERLTAERHLRGARAGGRAIGPAARGARHKPEKGEPTYGLWEHTASFGADWVESVPADEIVLRPWVYRAEQAAGRIRRAIRGR